MPKTPLDTEEYVEQTYFFRVFRERLDENLPSQEILASLKEEVLATTKLPLAIEFLTGEILLNGHMHQGMARLSHYFTQFQTFIMAKAEDDYSRFDQRTALEILQHEADYRSKTPTPAGLFTYQFECLSRNKLGYDQGMQAIASDPMYDELWSEWILQTRRQLGTTDFADLMSLRSEYYVNEMRRTKRDPGFEPSEPPLFSARAGRIAFAHRGRDPLYLFAALQRHLDYPAVPRPRPADGTEQRVSKLQAKVQQMEKRLTLLERESKGDLDLKEFYEAGDQPQESPWSDAAGKELDDLDRAD